MEKELTDKEKEYYSPVRKAFVALAPFYDVIVAPFSDVRDRVVVFTNAEKRFWSIKCCHGNRKTGFCICEKRLLSCKY